MRVFKTVKGKGFFISVEVHQTIFDCQVLGLLLQPYTRGEKPWFQPESSRYVNAALTTR